MAFWTDSTLQDPKRAYRFGVTIGGNADFGGFLFYAKKCSRPKMSMTEVKQAYLNYDFWFPGRYTWEAVTLTVVDIVNPDVSAGLAQLARTAGYQMPGNPNARVTVAKNSAIGALGNMNIEMIDNLGKVLEEWSLRNAWVKDMTFSELDYASDELSSCDITVRFDWAELRAANGRVFNSLDGQNERGLQSEINLAN